MKCRKATWSAAMPHVFALQTWSKIRLNMHKRTSLRSNFMQSIAFHSPQGEFHCKTPNEIRLAFCMAEKKRFELLNRFWRLRDFQSRALDQTRRLLQEREVVQTSRDFSKIYWGEGVQIFLRLLHNNDIVLHNLLRFYPLKMGCSWRIMENKTISLNCTTQRELPLYNPTTRL